ncbi:SH3-binding, glutamic acid-rich protein [Kalmanozyma brasiliensis GHG001]|uniref:Uncharacterized protein n=1 Tax=Kalmanozyma brasiliensis (strain GHG001) TaxID=1365824 RepID=V5EZH6_KALBG|nr:SH3-binding, glutamic acid-rich protein [Kalmanozyma brasiliensis GHG001]EST08274.1 SH3-binding, glutamic acid-rich protein [Kalmanozyma brasiliensis GHG001]
MAGPVVELFSTSILSNVKVRSRHERYTSVLAIKKVPYVYHDLASDDDAKSRWRRKAKDPQLPGILVNNEWVGSFDEFEEAVEFGELELFLGVAPAEAQTLPTAPHPAQFAVSSKDPSLYPTLPYAAEGAGRWKEPDADQFISSLNIKEEELNDADVDAMLTDIGKLASAPASTTEKKYVPSKEAAIKPLRFAKMGPTTSHQRMPSGSSGTSSPAAGTRASPIARYSATQRSTKALAAEADALTSNRKTSGALLREAVSQGKTLDDAMEESRMRHVLSQDNIDDLFASLGLSNVDIGDDEVDQFLDQGAIPKGLRLGGDRVHRSSSRADKARDTAVAKDLVLKAREKGHGSARTSLSNDGSKLAQLQPASSIGTAAETQSSLPASILAVPSQAANIVEGVPKASGSDGIEANEAPDVKEVELDGGVAIKSGDDSEDTLSNAVNEDEATAATRQAIDSGADKEEGERAETKLAAADQAVGSNGISTIASEQPVVPSLSLSSQDESHVSEKGSTLAKAEPTISSTDAQDPPATGTVAPSRSGVSLDTDGDESEPIVRMGDDKGEDKVEAAASAAADGEAASVATSEVPSVVTASQNVKVQGSDAIVPVEVEGELTPTKEAPSLVSTAAEPTQPASTAAASLETHIAEDDDFSLELAQAASIASRYEERKTPTPSPQRPSISSGLDAISPTKPTAVTSADALSPPLGHVGGEADQEDSESPLHLGVEAAVDPSHQTSSRRQASSSSTSSRRAIDVPRPIAPQSVSPPASGFSDNPMSPDTLAKRKKGILGFGLGRDKEKDKENLSTNTNAANSKAGGGVTRGHERTISQILRDADAVLQSDDYEEAGGEDTVDSAMLFGSATVDVEAGQTPSLRGASRPL